MPKFERAGNDEVSSCGASKGIAGIRRHAPFRPGPSGSDIPMPSTAICVGASAFVPVGAADFEGRNDGFRDAAAEMEVARDNAKELFLLTLPSLHCHLQKAWLPKGSERESLRALPLRVYSLASLVQKVGWAKNIFRRSKMSKWGHEFPLINGKGKPLLKLDAISFGCRYER